MPGPSDTLADCQERDPEMRELFIVARAVAEND
jgi:DNA gyrase/topoisomerase IV subunit B